MKIFCILLAAFFSVHSFMSPNFDGAISYEYDSHILLRSWHIEKQKMGEILADCMDGLKFVRGDSLFCVPAIGTSLP